MSLIKLSDVRRNINLPLVWRYEFSAGAEWPYSLPVVDGLTVLYARVVPLTEISHLKCTWKAIAGTAAAAASLDLSIYIDTVLLDLGRAYCTSTTGQTGTAEDVLLNHAASDATVEFKLQATTATIVAAYYKCSIDVCRA